jgi:secondary thiamine-phosphate synthase enzyme
MTQTQHILTIRAPRPGLLEITEEITDWVNEQKIAIGLLTIFIRHTSASILIQENADADVQYDLEKFLSNLAPEEKSLYRHSTEGPDDMPAHIKAALTQTQLSIPIQKSKMLLGTWQGIYLFEHRKIPPDRQIVLHLSAD